MLLSPFCSDLMLMNLTLEPLIKRVKSELQSVYGERLVQLVLFGSQARGDASQESDIDLMAVLEGEVNYLEERKRTADTLYQLSYENDQVLTCLFVSKDRYVHEKSPLLLNIRREGLPV
jgi:predicted nucleotidyltransferase